MQVLLNNTLSCRVSDFGMSRFLPLLPGTGKGRPSAELGQNFGKDQRNKFDVDLAPGPMPIRWLPAEVICESRFSEKSDVWSFGVLCTELFSNGVLPYKGVGNADVFKRIVAGGAPDIPQGTDHGVSTVIQRCFIQDADDRPSFQEVADMHAFKIQRRSLFQQMMDIDETGSNKYMVGEESGGHATAPISQPAGSAQDRTVQEPRQRLDSDVAEADDSRPRLSAKGGADGDGNGGDGGTPGGRASGRASVTSESIAIDGQVTLVDFYETLPVVPPVPPATAGRAGASGQEQPQLPVNVARPQQVLREDPSPVPVVDHQDSIDPDIESPFGCMRMYSFVQRSESMADGSPSDAGSASDAGSVCDEENGAPTGALRGTPVLRTAPLPGLLADDAAAGTAASASTGSAEYVTCEEQRRSRVAEALYTATAGGMRSDSAASAKAAAGNVVDGVLYTHVAHPGSESPQPQLYAVLEQDAAEASSELDLPPVERLHGDNKCSVLHARTITEASTRSRTVHALAPEYVEAANGTRSGGAVEAGATGTADPLQGQATSSWNLGALLRSSPLPWTHDNASASSTAQGSPQDTSTPAKFAVTDI